MKIQICLLLSTILLNSKISTAQPQVPSQKEISYITNILYKGGSQTGFFYGTTDKKNLLITAKHLFNQKFKRQIVLNGKKIVQTFDSLTVKNGDTITFQINVKSGWVKCFGTVFLHQNPNVDIAVIRHNIVLDPNAYILDENNSIFGQDCFFPGYPLGLTMMKGAEFNDLRIPIIKKGVISGMTTSQGGVTAFLIDGNNTYGLSGSPVLFYDYDLKSFKILGVVSGYLPQINVSYDNSGNKIEQKENSGIIIAHSISYANQIISSIK